MTNPELRAQLSALPKIELHRHLEGAIRLDTLVEVARSYGVMHELPTVDADSLRPLVQVTTRDRHDAAHFLGKFAVLRRFFVSEAVIRRIAREAVLDAAADNVRYIELRFTPKALAKLNGYPFEQVTRWVCEAVREAQSETGTQARLLVAINRHESIADAEAQIGAAIACQDLGVAGVDLCGQEIGYPAAPFRRLFAEAREAGLGVTIHAGEWDTPLNIVDAIEHMGATRIGHGVRVVEDSAVAIAARAAKVTFEVCPTSNLQTGVVPSIGDHPLRTMTEIGLRTTINADDPAISGITLSDEYVNAVETIGLPVAEVIASVRRATEAAFLTPQERAALLTQIEAGFADARSAPPQPAQDTPARAV